MSMFSRMLKKVLPPPEIVEQERFLFIGPHPDDIEIGAGATAARLAAMGKAVKFLICTDGRYGTEDPDMDVQKLIKIRQEEARAAAASLGVSDVEFLPYPDGGGYERADLMNSIVKVICEFRPDIIFAPDSRLRTETHLDHLNVGEAASNAFIISGCANMMAERGLTSAKVKGIAYYFTNRPNQYVKTTGFVTKQIEAIKLFKSQFPDTPEWQENLRGMLLYFRMRAVNNGFRKGWKTADAFCVLGPIHAHCAPEADNF